MPKSGKYGNAEKRREELLVLAERAEEKANSAKDPFVKEAWMKVAEAYRHLASLQ